MLCLNQIYDISPHKSDKIKLYPQKLQLKELQIATKNSFTTKQRMFRANNIPKPWKFTRAALGTLLTF